MYACNIGIKINAESVVVPKQCGTAKFSVFKACNKLAHSLSRSKRWQQDSNTRFLSQESKTQPLKASFTYSPGGRSATLGPFYKLFSVSRIRAMVSLSLCCLHFRLSNQRLRIFLTSLEAQIEKIRVFAKNEKVDLKSFFWQKKIFDRRKESFFLLRSY